MRKSFIVTVLIAAVLLFSLLKFIDLYYEKTHMPFRPDKTPEQLAQLSNEEKFNYYMGFVERGHLVKGFSGCYEIVDLAPQVPQLLFAKFENDTRNDVVAFVSSLGIQKILGKDAENYFGKFLNSNDENLLRNSIKALAHMKSKKYLDKIFTLEKHSNPRIRGAVIYYYSFFQDTESIKYIKSLQNEESRKKIIKTIKESSLVHGYRTENDIKVSNSCSGP